MRAPVDMAQFACVKRNIEKMKLNILLRWQREAVAVEHLAHEKVM